MTARPSIYTKDFMLLSASSFLFFASFNMLIPELPGYLTNMGGGAYIGLIIALFTLTAGISRPFSGKLTDSIGRIPVMVFGALVSAAVSLMYPLMANVTGFLALRLVHGFSTGFTPTGTSAYVADIAPATRRGEALGMHSLFASLGMAAGPALGGYIASISSMNVLFVASAVVALLSVAIVLRLQETMTQKQPLHPRLLKLGRNDIFEPRVVHPSMVLFFLLFAFGVILTLVPGLSASLGIQNKGLFFAVFTLASITVRFFAGKASDRWGRVPVLLVSSLTMILALYLIGHATTRTELFVGAVIFGFSSGMTSPTISAWTIDLSLEQARGKALATMFIALEAGIGLGALLSGWLFDQETQNFAFVFNVAMGMAVMAFFYLMVVALRMGLFSRRVV
jgi:MFS family permease